MDVPRFVFNLANFAIFILLTVVAVNLPLQMGAWLLRRRVRPWALKVVVALGFAVATGYVLYGMDRFDVCGGTGLTAYVPWCVAVGLAGWFIARTLLPPRRGRFAR